MATSEKKRVSPAEKIGIWHCTAVLFSQVPKLCTDLDFSLFYILILATCSKFTRKYDYLALGVCFPQPCSSAGRRFAASRSRLQNYPRIVSFPQPKIRWNSLYTGFHWESAFLREIPNTTLKEWTWNPWKRNQRYLIGFKKHEDRFCNPFFDLVQKMFQVHFLYLLLHGNSCEGPWTLRKFPQKCQKIAGCEECAGYGSRPPIASKLCPSPTERPGLDIWWVNHGLTQRAPVPPLLVLCLVFSNKKSVTKWKWSLQEVVQGQVASDHGWLVILSRPGRSGGDEPSVEAVGGREP